MSVYAVSDIHGNYNVWQKIKEKLKPEDTLYILGDCADRGKDGWKIIKEAFVRPNTYYIKGNHEDMLAGAIREICVDDYPGDSYQNLIYNGGESTFSSWMADGSKFEWSFKLNKLPEHLTYTNAAGQIFELTHAGFTPPLNEFKDLIWSRQHFRHPWPQGFDNVYIVHGHTPSPYLAEKLGIEEHINEPLVYADGHKICIDNLTVRTGAAILYNLDTMTFELIK